MGKVGPNPQTNDRSSLVMDLVRSEDKTMNHSDPMRAQTCVILVKNNRMLYTNFCKLNNNIVKYHSF